MVVVVVIIIISRQKRAAREQRNKYKPRTETRTTPSNQTRRQAGGLIISSHTVFDPHCYIMVD